MATRSEVELFLKELKDKIQFLAPPEIVFRPRDKNLASLAELDITAYQRRSYLLNLKAEDIILCRSES